MTDSFDEEVVKLLQAGGAGLLPSDTVYGLSCRALDRAAVERLHKLKNRGADKPFIVLISDIKMLDLLSIPPGSADLVKRYWPGPLSVVFNSAAPDFLARGTGSLAVRLPNYPKLLELIDKTGPLISTSANFRGEKTVKSVAEAERLFGDRLDFYVDAGELDNPPSTLARINDAKLEIIRPGAVKID